MAIAFDSASKSAAWGSGGTTETWSHTCTGSDRILFVGTFSNNAGTRVAPSSITYDGVAMTKIDEQFTDGGTSFIQSLWYLVAPATGTNNIVATWPVTKSLADCHSVSYTGASQTGVPDATVKNTSGSATSITSSITTVADNSWIVAETRYSGGGTLSSGTNATIRVQGDEGRQIMTDSNGAITPAGATDYTINASTASLWATIGASFAPVAPPAATVKAIPVNAAKVAATLADYPAYVQPSAMTGWGSLTLAEAQSLRFYSDSGLTTELAREVVSADEIHVKVPSLTTSTTIYASYNGTDADYATSATYGAEAVWSDYDHVWHLGDTVDSTGNAANGTATGVTVGTGKIGEESTFSAGDIIISSGMVDTNQNSTFSLQTWAKTSAATGWFLTHQNNSNFHSQKDFGILNGDLFFLINPINSGGSQIFVEEESLTYTDNVWHLLHITYGGSNTATNVSMYKDGAGVTEVIKKNNNSNTPPTSLPVFIGSRGNAGGDFTGSLDEMRIASSELSTNWITTEYNNQSDVGTFWGTVTDAGGGGAAAKNPLFTGGGIG